MSVIDATPIFAAIQASGMPPFEAFLSARRTLFTALGRWLETRPHSEDAHDELTATHNALNIITICHDYEVAE